METTPARQRRDTSDFFREHPFPGRVMLSWAIGIWAVVGFLTGWILNTEMLPGGVNALRGFILLSATPLYFVGFWRGVVGKGYPRMLFILSLVPLVGLLVLFYFPNRSNVD